MVASATSTAVTYALTNLDGYAFDHVDFSETWLYLGRLVGASIAVIMFTFMPHRHTGRRSNLTIYRSSAATTAAGRGSCHRFVADAFSGAHASADRARRPATSVERRQTQAAGRSRAADLRGAAEGDAIGVGPEFTAAGVIGHLTTWYAVLSLLLFALRFTAEPGDVGRWRTGPFWAAGAVASLIVLTKPLHGWYLRSPWSVLADDSGPGGWGMAAIAHVVVLIIVLVQRDPTTAEAYLSRLAAAALDAHGEVRSFIAGSAAGSRLDWSTAIAATLRRLGEEAGLDIEYSVQAGLDDDALSRPIAAHLVRIVQEALLNVSKHARARRLPVTVEADDGWLQVVVADDCAGLADPAAPIAGTGFGMRFMHERAALHGRPTHAVVCDLASVSAACVLALLEAHPRLTVVIVDPNADRALALTCRRPPMRTIDDLVAVLLNGDGGHADVRHRTTRGGRASRPATDGEGG